MGEKIATRAAYGDALVELGGQYPDLVVLDADLSGSTMTKGFAKAYPQRFFNRGIAEGNMMSVAAGLAAAGKKAFAASFAMFAAGRAFEQVRNSIAYPHLNVTVVGSHGGLSVGEDGATHQACEDMAVMRAIPGMVVCCPCDGTEMKAAVKALMDYDGPAYLRLGRSAVEYLTGDLPGYSFQLGKGVTLRDGGDVTIIVVGLMVQEAMKAADTLAGEGMVLAVCKVFPVPFARAKVGFDVTLVVLSCILSFLFLHGLVGVREGTVAAALLVGVVARQVNRPMAVFAEKYLT